MPPQELPRLRAAAADLAERGGAQGLATGLDALLDGCGPNVDDLPAADGTGAGPTASR
jgi:hypothetical protein